MFESVIGGDIPMQFEMNLISVEKSSIEEWGDERNKKTRVINP